MLEDNFSKMQHLSREYMNLIWEAAKTGQSDALSEEDALLAKIMLEHEDEYFNEFETADITERDYDPDYESSPFLHITFHTIVENQLKAKDPIEVYQFYLAMLNKKADRHDVIHMIGNIFSHFMFYVLKYGQPFDEKAYRRALKILKDKKPEKVWAELDKDNLDIYADN